MRSSRLTANALVATVLGTIPAFVGTVESEGQQMKQCWIEYEKKSPKKYLKRRKKIPGGPSYPRVHRAGHHVCVPGLQDGDPGRLPQGDAGQRRPGSVPDPNSDPDPDPPDPRVFWPSGSGCTNRRYGSGSGSFYHHAKIIRKILNPSILWLFLTFLSLKNNVNVPPKSITGRKNCVKKLVFCWHLEG